MNDLYHRIFDSKKVIVFDIDGTLVYLMDEHSQAYIDCIWELCHVKVKRYDDVSKHYGIQNQETFRRVLNDYHIPFTEELIEKLVKLRGEKIAGPSILISTKNILPGVETLLLQLKKDGKNIATITGNSRVIGEALLRKTNLTHHFDIRVCGDDEVDGKPVHGRHEMIARVLQLLEQKSGEKFSKVEVLVVGDMAPDVQGAQKAGMDSLAVATGGVSLEILRKENPTFGLNSFTELE